MSIAGAFLLIGSVTVVFLLRFLFALQSELRPARGAGRLPRAGRRRVPVSATAWGPGLTLVHSRADLAPAPPAAAAAKLHVIASPAESKRRQA